MMLTNAAPNVDPRTVANSQVRREKQPQRSRFSIRQALKKDRFDVWSGGSDLFSAVRIAATGLSGRSHSS